MTKPKIPQIRFRGFTDEWKEKELGEISDVYDGTHQTPKYKDIGIMFLSVENIKNLNSNKYISEEDFEKDFKVYPEKGDVLMTRIGDIGTANLIQSDQLVAYYVSLALLKSPIINASFLKEVIHSEKVSSDLWHRTLHIAFPKKINKGEIEKVIITYPKENTEQTQIGNYFQKLDDLIAKTRNKLDKLKNMKQACLSKMFPQRGATTPQIRFSGYSDEWEEKVLGEMMEVTSVKRIHQSDWTDSGIRFLRARDIVSFYKNEKQSDILYISESKYLEYSTISGKVRKGDLLVTGVGTIGVPLLIADNEPVYFKDGNIIWFKNNNIIEGLFFFYSFSNSTIQNYIKESAGTGTVGTYTIDSGKKTPLLLPNNKLEQTQIGNFFKNLDNLITLNEKQLGKLQNIKASCLDKMFVNNG